MQRTQQHFAKLQSAAQQGIPVNWFDACNQLMQLATDEYNQLAQQQQDDTPEVAPDGQLGDSPQV